MPLPFFVCYFIILSLRLAGRQSGAPCVVKYKIQFGPQQHTTRQPQCYIGLIFFFFGTFLGVYSRNSKVEKEEFVCVAPDAGVEDRQQHNMCESNSNVPCLFVYWNPFPFSTFVCHWRDYFWLADVDGGGVLFCWQSFIIDRLIFFFFRFPTAASPRTAPFFLRAVRWWIPRRGVRDCSTPLRSLERGRQWLIITNFGSRRSSQFAYCVDDEKRANESHYSSSRQLRWGRRWRKNTSIYSCSWSSSSPSSYSF